MSIIDLFSEVFVSNIYQLWNEYLESYTEQSLVSVAKIIILIVYNRKKCLFSSNLSRDIFYQIRDLPVVDYMVEKMHPTTPLFLEEMLNLLSACSHSEICFEL